VVPVGRSTLGRLFNVLGATIDSYVGLDELPIYSDYPLSLDQYNTESTSDTLIKVQFTCASAFSKEIELHAQDDLRSPHLFQELLTFFSSYLSKPTGDSAHTTQLERLGLVCIMGIGSEIIKARNSLLDI
jgi:hypothetical protein